MKLKIKPITYKNCLIGYQLDNALIIDPSCTEDSFLQDLAYYLRDLIKTMKGIEVVDPYKQGRVMYILKDGTYIQFTTMNWLLYLKLVEKYLRKTDYYPWREEEIFKIDFSVWNYTVDNI